MEGGTYTITISGYPDDASFDQTTAEVTIAQADQTINRNFTGSWIRTASLMGMVSVEGTGIAGITVAISGRQDAQMLTDDNGQYTFTGLRAGNYTVEISGFDATDVAFSATSSAVEVAVGESKVWSFEGTYVRESAVAGQVSVEGSGLSGVTVSLQGMGADEEQMTDAGGQYTFSNLRAGEYQVAISGFDTNEYGFSATSATVRVEHGRTANVPFEGIMLRTASIMGQVSIEGEGLADVTVSLSGEGESQTAMTNEAGQYAFTELPAGNFQVAISGYDTDDYSFETTAKNVALALGETATVPFEGILLRTSGISGRVSVEGTGLDSVTVTLSGDDLDDDMTTMTDATGQYAIAGLAEGDYTVAISGYDDVSYIFDVTSMDVTLGDDDTQIVNFMGMHARTASVTVRMFVDELAKNNLHDDGEHAFPSAEMLAGVDPQAVPMLLEGLKSVVTLTGPGVHDTNDGMAMLDGSFVFAGLRAGQYQLVVNDIPATLLAALPQLQDYAYGGPATGYPIALTVGQAASQNVPIDITHTTVNFGVTLKAGDNLGPPLEGASVTLYRDAAGTLKIDDAMTGATGMASIRIARAGTTGNTVYAAVAAPAGSYHTSGAMQAVPWNSQYPATVASNDADIVNTMADFSFSGATIMTDFGGGMALGGWAVSVMSGDEAVDGAPDELGDDGSASFSESVDAGDLPKTYMISMADDQANDSTGDGGEKYTSTTLSHTHDGLSLAGTSTDAGVLMVTYTTQTLKVYVHQEIDQVMGYTGNVLGGDVRMGGIIDVDIEHIASNGRATSFEATDSIRSSASGGAYTFRNVPAAANVIVTADEFATLGTDADGDPIANTAHLLDKNGHSDELAAYTGMDANGIMGGAFGAQGGFNHTVELCPLMSAEGDQRHGECGTFAFVETFAVDGQAWKWVRGKTSDDFASSNAKSGEPGLTVNMDPVDGENLAGESDSFEEKGNTKGFNFGHMPAGVYKVTVPSGWRAQRGPLDSPTNDLAARLSPLDSALNIDVTPTTGYAYGAVTDSENRRLAGVTVNVNGVSVTTDSNGRYVAEGFGSASTCRTASGTLVRRNAICVKTAEEGSEPTTNHAPFAANSPTRINVTIMDAAEVTMISGRVTHSDGGAGVGGVRVRVGSKTPLNPNAKSSPTRTTNNIYVTDGSGNFSVRVVANTGGTAENVTVSKNGMFFSPDMHSVGLVAGATISGINFTAFDNGTIHGRVVDASNNPITGVIVTATQVSPGTATDADTTGTTGTYSLSVRYGQYDVTASKHGYSFTSATGINVPNDGKAIDDLEGTPATDNADLSSLSLSGVTLRRSATLSGFRTGHLHYTAEVRYATDMTTVTATPSVPGASVSEIYPEDVDATTSGHQVALDVGTTVIEVEVTAADGTTKQTYTVTVTRLAETTTITGTITDAQSGDAISGVRITPNGGHLLGGDEFESGDEFVTTNSSGEYKVEMESGSGITTLTPSKTGYTFEPGSRDVQLNAGEVTGADFTGSSYATITGTVVYPDGTAIMGATVTATSQGISDSDTSDRRGRFSVSVPSGTATITAEVDGYTFASQSIALSAGESRSVGNIMAEGTSQPTDVEAKRDTADTGEFDGNVTVTWAAGGTALAAGTYQAQTCEPAAEDDASTTDNDETKCDNAGNGNWTNFGSTVAFDAADLTVTAASVSDDRFSVRVQANDGTNPAANSSVISVAAINAAPSGATATRDIDPSPDNLVVEWDGDRDADTEARIIGGFTSNGTTTWVVLSTVSFTDPAYSATDGDGDHQWTFAFESSTLVTGAAVVDGSTGVAIDANDDNTADTMDLTAAMMDGTFMIRVQARQPGLDFVDADDDNTEDPGEETWKTSDTDPVAAKN